MYLATSSSKYVTGTNIIVDGVIQLGKSKLLIMYAVSQCNYKLL